MNSDNGVIVRILFHKLYSIKIAVYYCSASVCTGVLVVVALGVAIGVVVGVLMLISVLTCMRQSVILSLFLA